MTRLQNSKVGYVILTWNSERYINRCLSSVFQVPCAASYVIVADNGSTDRTRELLACQHPPQGSRLEVIEYPKNRGTTFPRNAALKRLMKYQPDYYCILDSDTEISAAAIAVLVDEMEKHPEYGMIGPGMQTADGTQQMSARNFPTLAEKLCKAAPFKAAQTLGERLERPIQVSRADSYPVDYLISACWLLRPQAVQRAGLLDERIFYAPEDAEYCIRVWKSGYQVAFCPKAQILHEWQRLSKKKLFSRLNFQHLKGLLYMFAKHRYLLSARGLRKKWETQGTRAIGANNPNLNIDHGPAG